MPLPVGQRLYPVVGLYCSATYGGYVRVLSIFDESNREEFDPDIYCPGPRKIG
jgi:hypothetical protein